MPHPWWRWLAPPPFPPGCGLGGGLRLGRGGFRINSVNFWSHRRIAPCRAPAHGLLDGDDFSGGAGHIVCPGDWIITGVHGEYYPYKPDIFAAAYDPVEEK
ncbi:MAG: hypothetical protein EPN31_13755 [Castellaniella sp.]|nr:MAG: hypothetical protein EPN31_13755 [Castellaniella sp.]